MMKPDSMRNLEKYFYNTNNTLSGFPIDLDIYLDLSYFKNEKYITVTSIDNFFSVGKPKNILIEKNVHTVQNNVLLHPTTIYEETEITMNFFVSDFWYDYNIGVPIGKPPVQIDLIFKYEEFVKTFIGKKVWIKSIEHGLYNQFIGTKENKPTSILLNREKNSNIITGSIVLEKINSTSSKIYYGIPI